MALDRRSIEKTDFPIGRRGYDPDAVDAHLQRVADEYEGLRRSTGGGQRESVAALASDRVRAILDAAEVNASEIERQAQEEARRIREDADQEAALARRDAEDQAAQHIVKVSTATTEMRSRIDAIEDELAALLESLRAGADRLTAELSVLEGGMSAMAVPGEAEPEPYPEPEPEPYPEPYPEPASLAAEGEPSFPTASAEGDGGPGVEEPGQQPAAAEGPPAEGPDPSEGARLVALNMALNGTPREETDRYLADNFDLADRDGLLDEVYARVEG